MSEITLDDINNLIPESLLGLSGKQLKKFYSKWSVNASKLIKQYAVEHSLEWYNTKWRNKSKEIPFYIRTKAPKSFIGNVWFASRPANYAMDKSVGKLSAKHKIIPKKTDRKAVNVNGKWFTPKTYSPNIENVNTAITENGEDAARFFVSKTSHNKTRKYKKPLMWYETKAGNVAPLNLQEQLADHIYEDPALSDILLQSFKQTLENSI